MGKTPSELIDALGGTTEIAARLNMRPVAIRQWRARNRIPRSRWPDLADAFGLTTDELRATEKAAA